MTRLVYGALILVALAVVAVVLIDRQLSTMRSREVVVPSLAMIEKQEQLSPFHAGLIRIVPLRFDFDTNKLEYEYQTSYGTARDVFSRTDIAALEAGWKLQANEDGSRTYSKLFDVAEEIVVLTFNSESGHVMVMSGPSAVMVKH